MAATLFVECSVVFCVHVRALGFHESRKGALSRIAASFPSCPCVCVCFFLHIDGPFFATQAQIRIILVMISISLQVELGCADSKTSGDVGVDVLMFSSTIYTRQRAECIRCVREPFLMYVGPLLPIVSLPPTPKLCTYDMWWWFCCSWVHAYLG